MENSGDTTSIQQIADTYLDIGTLEGRGSIEEDFHDLHVGHIKNALTAAQRHGQELSKAEIMRLETEVQSLKIALHDAIVRPKGVVPESAEPFYSVSMAERSEQHVAVSKHHR